MRTASSGFRVVRASGTADDFAVGGFPPAGFALAGFPPNDVSFAGFPLDGFALAGFALAGFAPEVEEACFVVPFAVVRLADAGPDVDFAALAAFDVLEGAFPSSCFAVPPTGRAPAFGLAFAAFVAAGALFFARFITRFPAAA